MDLEALIKQLKSDINGSKAKKQTVGRTDFVCIESEKLFEVVDYLKNSERFTCDRFESLSLFQDEGEIVLTYVFRNNVSVRPVYIRTAIPLPAFEEYGTIESIEMIWPGVRIFEVEAENLFGVRFVGAKSKSYSFFSDEWVGFPLRKDFELEAFVHQGDDE